MKNKLFFGLLTAILMLTAMPTSAQDYLKVFFKDGHTERHFMHLVENITATKYDLDGNLHSDYQMQQIVTADTTYSYYLADIDSVAFRKYNEEQVRERVETVQASLESIVNQCTSIEDLVSHVNEIKDIDGVEEVYSDGTYLSVQIRDWFEIIYHKEPLPDNTELLETPANQRNTNRVHPTNNDGSTMKVTIGFQMEDDAGFVNDKVQLNLLNTEFSLMNYDVTYNLGEELDFDFYYRRIFDSNVLLINTHGGYGILRKKHYLYTGIEANDRWAEMMWVGDLGIDMNHIDFDDVGISCCEHSDGLFGGKFFYTVKESFIQKSPYRFSGSGPHIVFVAACSSLEGSDVLHRSVDPQPLGSDSFAQIFFEKGADVYLGYNSGSYRACIAACSFFDKMLHCASVLVSYINLPDNYLYESDKDEKALLIDLYNKNSDNPQGIYIVNAHTVNQTNEELSAQYNNNGMIELKGNTARWENMDYWGSLLCGFIISTDPNVDQLNNYEELLSSNAHISDSNANEVIFSANFTPTPGQTYYYRACTYDGSYYNWGEERTFMIDNSEVVVPINGLVAYYPFNGNANDESGYGNHGSVIGNVELTYDRFGNANSAYRFFGQPLNYISIPDNDILHCSTFTLNAWVYTDGDDYGSGYLINKGRDIDNGSYRLYVKGVGASTLYGGSNDAYIEENPQTNIWHMITGTVEGDRAKYYLDGVLMDERTLSYPFVYSNNEPLTLGMHYYTGVPNYWAYPLFGILDDVRIYNKVLTPAEINALYRETRCGTGGGGSSR